MELDFNSIIIFYYDNTLGILLDIARHFLSTKCVLWQVAAIIKLDL